MLAHHYNMQLKTYIFYFYWFFTCISYTLYNYKIKYSSTLLERCYKKFERPIKKHEPNIFNALKFHCFFTF